MKVLVRMYTKQTKQYLLILLAGCLWGTIGVFMKQLNLVGSTPSYTTFLRMLFAFIMLLTVTLIKDGVKAFKVSKNTLISCVLLGTVSMFLENLCYNNAVNLLGVSLGVAMLYMAPVFTSIQSKILFKEQIGRNKMIALGLNVLGCVFAATGGDFSKINISLVGLLFGIGAAFTFSTLNIFGRLATDGASPFVVATYNFFFGTIATMLATRPWNTVENLLDPTILFYAFLFALIPTTIAYLLYFVGIQGLTETSKIPIFASMELVVATILGVIIFHEKPTAVAVIGIVLMLASIVIMNLKKSPLFYQLTL